MLNLNSSGSGRLNFLFSCSSRCLARVSAALSGGAASGFWRVLLLGDPLWTLAERSSRCSFRPGVRLSVTRRVCVREPGTERGQKSLTDVPCLFCVCFPARGASARAESSCQGSEVKRAGATFPNCHCAVRGDSDFGVLWLEVGEGRLGVHGQRRPIQ